MDIQVAMIILGLFRAHHIKEETKTVMSIMGIITMDIMEIITGIIMVIIMGTIATVTTGVTIIMEIIMDITEAISTMAIVGMTMADMMAGVEETVEVGMEVVVETVEVGVEVVEIDYFYYPYLNTNIWQTSIITCFNKQFK